MLQIMILLTTVFSIGTEIKHGTSRRIVSSITQFGRIGYYREITSANRSVFYHGSITAIYALRILAFPITQRNLADAGGNVLVGSCKPKLRRYHDEYSTIVKNRVEYSPHYSESFLFRLPDFHSPCLPCIRHFSYCQTYSRYDIIS